MFELHYVFRKLKALFFIKKKSSFFSLVSIMVHHMIHIKASKKQLSKLRNGHKVRISPAIEGEGCNLIIHPDRYNTVSRTFNKGKGMEIQLTPEEIVVNQEQAPAMEGTGIFGRKFDDLVRDTIGSRAKDVIYEGADKYIKPTIKAGISKLATYAPELASSALSGLATASGNPEFAIPAGMLGYQLGSKYGDMGSMLAQDYLDRPSAYQNRSNVGGPRNKTAPATLAGQVEQNHLFRNLNEDLGTRFGALAKANLENAVAHMDRAKMQNATVSQQLNPYSMRAVAPDTSSRARDGRGLYAGRGLGRDLRSAYSTIKREVGSVGRGAGMVGMATHLPPALVSQPFSANFQFQHTLPPAYQKFSKGGGLYA